MAKKALVIVDMQKAFFEGTNDLPQIPKDMGRNIIQRIIRLKGESRRKQIPIIYTIDSFSPEEAPIEPHFKLFGVHGIEGEEGTNVIEEVKLESGDFLIRKLRYDAFLGTRFDFILRELGVDTLIFTGIWLDACVQHTIMGAFFRCYKTILLEDCTTTPYEEDRVRTLEYIKKFYGTEITTSDKVISQL
ncbi:cysteine hydrolase [Patescibacteria group bacterium]|nr:cysteine hydrolase [Patescibacteria group bacterium]